MYLQKRGTNNDKEKESKNEKVRLKTAIRRFIPLNLFKIILEIHECQHILETSRSEIKESNDQQNKHFIEKNKRRTIALILSKFRDIVNLITGSDVSIHIKLFESNGITHQSTDKREGFYLKAFERIPSKKELKLRENNELECRTNKKTFITYKWEDDFIKKYSVKTNENSLAKSNLYINSAYSFVLGKNAHYWVSNNLNKDNEKGLYYSNNPDEKKYYNSLGVFLIGPHIRDGEVSERSAAGLLIIDSYHTNIFDLPFLRQVVGYITHRLYFYLTFIN